MDSTDFEYFARNVFLGEYHGRRITEERTRRVYHLSRSSSWGTEKKYRWSANRYCNALELRNTLHYFETEGR